MKCAWKPGQTLIFYFILFYMTPFRKFRCVLLKFSVIPLSETHNWSIIPYLSFSHVQCNKTLVHDPNPIHIVVHWLKSPVGKKRSEISCFPIRTCSEHSQVRASFVCELTHFVGICNRAYKLLEAVGTIFIRNAPNNWI